MSPITLRLAPTAPRPSVRPEGVIARDENDYYLVVAADKGTAAFSDTANAISPSAVLAGRRLRIRRLRRLRPQGNGHHRTRCLGVRQASLRRARPRRQTEEFTAVGIGDMSGDVFGNGLLRSEKTRLVAAFDHRDIFLDPNPDAAVSFEERRACTTCPVPLAGLQPRAISAGGVYSARPEVHRNHPEVREVLDLGRVVTELAPTELLSAILKAPVDLLYNGGIGTT